jgi:tetratricopeptide (TPR) repeat protein
MLKALYEHWENYNINEALKYGLQAEKIIEKYGAFVNEKLWLYNQMAQFNIFYGKALNAEKYLKKAEEILKQNPTLSGKYLFHSISAKVYMEKGDFDQAFNHINITDNYYSHKESGHNDDIAGLLWVQLLKQRILLKLGKANEVFQFVKDKSLKLNQLLGPNDHTTKYYTYVILADSALALGKLDIAEAALQQASIIIERMFKGKIKEYEQAYYYYVYAEYLMARNNLNQALVYYKKTEEVFKYIYDSSELYDIAKLYERILKLYVRRNDNKASQHYLDLLRQHFGYQHNVTMESTKYMILQNMSIEF